jgi:hypothetical protein
MKRRYWISVFTAAAGLGLFSGCAPHREVVVEEHPTTETTVRREVVVTEAPPALRVEEPVASPGPDYEWVPGFWSWDNHWVWNAGKWTVRPHQHALYQPGHWAHRSDGYVWIEGRWR